MKKIVLIIFALAIGLGAAAQDTVSGFILMDNYFYYPYQPNSEDSLYFTLGHDAGPFMKGESAKAFYTADSICIIGIAAALHDVEMSQSMHYRDTTYEHSIEYLRIYETRWDTLVALREAPFHMRHTPVSYYIDFGPENREIIHSYEPRIEAVYECMFEEPIMVCDTFLAGRSWYLNELFPVPGESYQMQQAPEIAQCDLCPNRLKPDIIPSQKTIVCMWSSISHRAYIRYSDCFTLLFPIIREPDTNDVGVDRHDLAWRYTAVHPNPAVGSARVTSSFGLSLIEVYNTEGVLVHRQQASGLTATLDVSAWPSGTYILRINTGAGTVTKRLVVRR